MPGQQLKNAIDGAQKERLADYLLAHFCATTKVPREQDFGVDFYCNITEPAGHVVRTSPYSFGLQIKTRSDDNVLSYGGLAKNGDPASWRAYEIEWLFNQAMPFLVGLTSPDRIDIYLTSGIWRARWQGGRPFRVDLLPDDPLSVKKNLLQPREKIVDGAPGDRTHWTVPLGPPIVSVSIAQVSDAGHIAKVRETLARSLDVERTNIMAHAQGVPYREWILGWETNKLPAPTETRLGTEWFANAAQGMNLERCARSLGIALPALVLNLQAQGNHVAVGRLRDAILLTDSLRPIPAGIKEKITNIMGSGS